MSHIKAAAKKCSMHRHLAIAEQRINADLDRLAKSITRLEKDVLKLSDITALVQIAPPAAAAAASHAKAP